MKLATKKEIEEIRRRFLEHYPDSTTELHYRNLYELLVAVMLSAQLPGVGQKTAHVVMIEYTQANLMAVDTHVFRVAHRLGLTDAKTVEGTEKDLVEKFKTDLHRIHQAMVLFGRYICTAKNPKCDTECFLTDLCKSKESFKAR